jgi:hypothetical protein
VCRREDTRTRRPILRGRCACMRIVPNRRGGDWGDAPQELC